MRDWLLALWSFVLAFGSLTLSAQSRLTPATLNLLDQRLVFWEQYGERCEGFPSKRHDDGSCDDGDAVIFNGLLCLSGYQDGCEAVRRSQDANGQWWRSPRQVGGAYRTENSFSRDMATGVLLYLLQTKDQSAALRWYEWLKNHREPIKVGILKLGKVSRLCHDEKGGTCVVTPAIWENMGRVYSAIDLPLQNAMRNPYAEFGELAIGFDKLLGMFGQDWEDLARLEVNGAKPGYRLHLKGVLAFMAKTINERSGQAIYDWGTLARELNKLQPKNLFFRYLAQGSSEALTRDLLTLCPTPTTLAPRREWVWERSDESDAYLRSMGWDCLFLGRLIEQSERPQTFLRLHTGESSDFEAILQE